MRHDTTFLLADDDHDRLIVLEHLLNARGYTVVSCASADDCIAQLRRAPTAFSALLSKATLHGVSLLPQLEPHWRRSQMNSTSLYLWSAHGTLDVYPFAAFLRRAGALVFSLPLDVDVLLRVVANDDELRQYRRLFGGPFYPFDVNGQGDANMLN